jgi:hypothetical protein
MVGLSVERAFTSWSYVSAKVLGREWKERALCDVALARGRYCLHVQTPREHKREFDVPTIILSQRLGLKKY